MKCLVFDAGPIISISANHILSILGGLKKNFDGKFILPLGVKRELVDRGLQTRRFKLEALQVQELIDKKVFTVPRKKEINAKARKILKLANTILSGHGNPVNIIQVGEAEMLAAALYFKAKTIVVDERITRELIESPESFHKFMEKRMHVKLKLNKDALKELSAMLRHLKVIRSIELVTVAFEMGLLDKYLVNIPHAKRELLESLLWGLKTEGASVTEREINHIVKSFRD